jgi:hypothetical protein
MSRADRLRPRAERRATLRQGEILPRVVPDTGSLRGDPSATITQIVDEVFLPLARVSSGLPA